ncbi:MAG: bifunctional riboflavin kinase/FAD synthetase, partial [Firmicutes bacterium]|nr:bifunctional riboflavin kinase/FAD synthetase [Bacillota bacterium]
LKARSIEIYDLKLVEVHADEEHPRIRISVKCSKGTYIRSLGRDIGEAMGTTAVIDRLERSAAGMFSLENAYTLEQVKDFCDRKDYSFIIPMEEAVKKLSRYDLKSGEEWRSVLDGTSFSAKDVQEGDIAIYDPSGDLMAIGESESGVVKPKKILWETRKRKNPMMIVNDWSDVSPLGSTAIVIGNFDGVHLGHRYLIEHCVKDAEKHGLFSAVLTFVPHPKVYFGDTEHRYLQSEDQKVRCIDQLGADILINAPFDDSISQMDEDTFISDILKKKLDAKCVFVGDDFSFGNNRIGTAHSLKEKCLEYGIEVKIIPQLTFRNAEISSSRIKKALSVGNIVEVSRLMGRPYSVEGEVVHGREIGRTIGFPTANLQMDPSLHLPCSGVYVAQVRFGGKKYEGVACIGSRPTIEEGQSINLEVHILNLDENLYGKVISVTLLSFLRGEKKFGSLEELKNAISEDKEKAKKYFQKRRSNTCN